MQDLSPADNQLSVLDALEQLLLQSDADALARHLGLRSEAAANALRKNPAALKRLSANIASVDGDDQAVLDAARTLLLGEGS